ncbi:MAG: type II toxin-antitoxin system RelE/ParE family toxin [Alphaproteobacteria bacterium]|nr:type II toxin-antitoxin system RelE/ParE family toxin [Alphaproteobacteria bacterium]
MNYTLRFTPTAMMDLAEIKFFIAKGNPTMADEFFWVLWEEVQSLKVMPNRCPLAPEAEKKGAEIRHHSYKNYRILFVIKNEQVRILRIVHGARVNIVIGDT